MHHFCISCCLCGATKSVARHTSYASIARLLVELLKKGGPFPMDEEQMKVFEALRNRLSTPPILSIFNPNRETELHTDASSRGFGAVLLQRQNDG